MWCHGFHRSISFLKWRWSVTDSFYFYGPRGGSYLTFTQRGEGKGKDSKFFSISAKKDDQPTNMPIKRCSASRRERKSDHSSTAPPDYEGGWCPYSSHKCGPQCGEARILVHGWWEMKLCNCHGQQWLFLQRVKVELLYGQQFHPRNSTLGK